MNLLLDSHTLLWLMEGNPSLSATASALIGEPANRLLLSMASVWEIGIKVGLKKMGLSVPYILDFPGDGSEWVRVGRVADNDRRLHLL